MANRVAAGPESGQSQSAGQRAGQRRSFAGRVAGSGGPLALALGPLPADRWLAGSGPLAAGSGPLGVYPAHMCVS